MKKNMTLTRAAIIAANIMLIGAVGCTKTNENVTDDMTTDPATTVVATNDDTENNQSDDAQTASNEDLTVNQGEENGENSEDAYNFTLNIYFSEEPVFNNPLSALEVDLGFEYSGKEYTVSEEDGETKYYDGQSNLLATVNKEDDKYSVEVYDSEVSFNIKADTGIDNECLNLLNADIEIGNETSSFSYEDNYYRSYTGVWFFGIGKIQGGKIGAYDASWTQVEF